MNARDILTLCSSTPVYLSQHDIQHHLYGASNIMEERWRASCGDRTYVRTKTLVTTLFLHSMFKHRINQDRIVIFDASNQNLDYFLIKRLV